MCDVPSMEIEPGPSGLKTDVLSIRPRVMCDNVCVVYHVSCVTRCESRVMCHVSRRRREV